jgi:flagellar protein FliL
MSTATAAPDAGAAAPKAGKKKLLIIIGAVVLLLLVGGGGAVFMMMKSKAAAAEAEAEEGGGKSAKKEAKGAPAQLRDPKNVPAFILLEPFTVNLADREAERYAQVGISLEMTDAKQIDVVKAYMPVIRNNILMLLADKTTSELMARQGKEKLAEQIRKATSRALGVEVEEDEEEEAETTTKKKKKKRVPVELPVAAVHFSNFIIQ